MKRYNHIGTLTAVIAAAVVLLAGCAKNTLTELDRSQPPAGMGEVTLGELQLIGGDASERAQTRATGASNLPAGATLRLYAFLEGETDFGSKLATRTYTISATGEAKLDGGQEPLYLPVGKADIYLVGPVEHTTGSATEEVASEWGIYPRVGVDLIAAYAQTRIVAGDNNPLPAMVLEHKMARTQVVVETNPDGVYENLVVEEVKLYGQPSSGTFALDQTGGVITAGSTLEDFVCPSVDKDPNANNYSATTVLMPQAQRELKIETTFTCNQKNVEQTDNHPTIRYRQSGLITAPLAAGTATRFSTAPITPVEIKWRTKVLPWNEVAGGDLTIPGLGLEVPYVEIDGLRWATGNLVAHGTNDCRVGKPNDGGLFFQFGSLIGWSGGTSGDGTGQSQGPTPTIPALNQQVWPVEMGATKPTFGWQNSNGSGISTLKNFYFNYSSGVWGTENPNSDIGTFAEPISGDTGSGNLRGGRYATLGVGDPCTYYLGEPWRTPTQTELLALKNRGYSDWTTVGGMPGRWFGPGAGDAKTSIFLGAAAHRYYSHSNIWHPDAEGRYGASSVKNATQYFYMYVNNSKVISPDQHNRSSGVPARCVSGTYTPPPADSYIPTSVIKAAGWTNFPGSVGLQVAMRGDKQMPGSGTPGTDATRQWKTLGSTTVGVESVGSSAGAQFAMGKASTDAMVATPELAAEHPAAQYCRDMGPEWYLPGLKELKLIYDNRSVLGSSYTFNLGDYWSSTENSFTTTHARTVDFSNGGMYTTPKSTPSYSVRCVREI